MPTESEPLFGGSPTIPSPEVFEQARRNNPVWYQVLERAYAQFVALPENTGIYADPKAGGATIQEIWLAVTLNGVAPYCLLARPLPAIKTERITRLVNCTPTQLIDWLRAIQTAEGTLNVLLAYHDGTTGHCIRITAYDAGRDRFVYHDPWPERSLLARENNAVGVDAQPEGKRWSVTRQELERVAFSAFVFPSDWARVQGQDFDVRYEHWQKSEFFTFFRLKQLVERVEGGLAQRVFAPGAFKEKIALVVDSTHAGKITKASLRVHRDWMIENLLLAIDLGKSFIASFAPPPDQAQYAEIAEALWSVRNRGVLVKMEDADPDESDGIRCVQAFLGKRESAMLWTDFGYLSIGSAKQDGHPVQFIEIALS